MLIAPLRWLAVLALLGGGSLMGQRVESPRASPTSVHPIIQVDCDDVAGLISLDDVDTTAVPGSKKFNCSDLTDGELQAQLAPGPTAGDLPTYLAGDGTIQSFSLMPEDDFNLRLTYEDSPAVGSCAQDYTVVRTYTLRDGCSPEDVLTYTQTIRITDVAPPLFTAPAAAPNGETIVVGSNLPGQCGAIVVLDMPGITVTDDCGEVATLTAQILPANNGATPNSAPVPVNVNNFTNELSELVPPGDYLIRYRFADECGNAGLTDVNLKVVDSSPPAPVCAADLTVRLAFGNEEPDGLAVLTSTTMDRGSYDDCSPGVDLAIAPVTVAPDGSQTPIAGAVYGPSIVFDCDQLGPNIVGLRVTDGAGNVAFCETIVEVTGQANLTCTPPTDVTLSCVDYDELNLSDSPTDADYDAAFGAAAITGACAIAVLQTISGELDDCGSGVFVRDFSASIPTGETVDGPCRQTITVVGAPNYSITFPGDREGNCTETPTADEVLVAESSCDMIVTTVSSRRVETGGPQCYNLAVTYRSINLCEFDIAATELTVPRNFDGNATTDEPVTIHFFGNDPADETDDVVRLDRDAVRTNGGFNPLLVADYASAPGRGGYRYTQIIRVVDRTGPTIDLTEPLACFALAGEACTGTATFSYSLSDDCTSANAISGRVELDVDFGGTDFTRTRFLVAEELTDLGAGNYEVVVTGLPKGAHALRIVAEDDCGNVTPTIVTFCVDDISNAAPVCLPNTVVTLRATGGGVGTAAVFALDFIGDDVKLCGAPVTYSVYTLAEAERTGFVAEEGRDGLVLDCSSAAAEPMRVYAFSSGGGGNFCSVTALVQRFPGACDVDRGGSIAGTVTSETGFVIPGVEIMAEGTAADAFTETDADGRFQLSDLARGDDYVVSAFLNDYGRHRKGVTTADIVLITRHILGVADFSNPYQFLAADPNGDERITVGDIIAIRRLILGLDLAYRSNFAYRFVNADYVFPIPTNPWATQFAETISVNNLPGDATEANFIGVMVGDVNNTGFNQLGAGAGAEKRVGLALRVEDKTLQAGSIYNIDIYPGELAGCVGMQGSMEISPRAGLLSVLPGSFSSDMLNPNYLKDGLFSFAYSDLKGLDPSLPLFTLRLRSNQLTDLSSVLSLSDRLTAPEGVRDGLVFTPGLVFGGELEEGSVMIYPNPMGERGRVVFWAGGEGVALLEVFDGLGRLVYSREAHHVIGKNSILLDRNKFPLTALSNYILKLEDNVYTGIIISKF